MCLILLGYWWGICFLWEWGFWWGVLRWGFICWGWYVRLGGGWGCCWWWIWIICIILVLGGLMGRWGRGGCWLGRWLLVILVSWLVFLMRGCCCIIWEEEGWGGCWRLMMMRGICWGVCLFCGGRIWSLVRKRRRIYWGDRGWGLRGFGILICMGMRLC